MQRFDQASIFLQGPSKSTFAGIGVELVDEERRGHPAQTDRACHPEAFVPPVENPGTPDAPAHIRLEPRIALHVEGPRGVQALPPQIPQAWRETEPDQITEREDDLRIAMGVRGM